MGLGRRPSRARLELAATLENQRLRLAATFEKLPQEACGFIAAHAAKYIQTMRQPRLARQINHATAGPCLRVPSTEHDPCQASIQHGAHAHGTRLQRRVERRRAQPIVALHLRAGTQRNDFRMRGRVVTRHRSIPALSDHLIIENHQRPDGYFAGVGSTLRKNERASHEIGITGPIHGGPANRCGRMT